MQGLIIDFTGVGAVCRNNQAFLELVVRATWSEACVSVQEGTIFEHYEVIINDFRITSVSIYSGSASNIHVTFSNNLIIIIMVPQVGLLEDITPLEERRKSLQWNPSIAATIGEWYFGCYAEVAVVEGFQC